MTSSASASRPYRTVVVEGNIASGKTMLLEYFKKFENVKIFPEPVEKWRNFNGHNMLDLLYKDTARWSFAFQMYADLTRLQVHQSKDNLKAGDVKLMERSFYSGRYCFAENSYRSKNMSPADYAILEEYFQWMVSNLQEILHVDLIVYLRVKPEVCHQRLLQRGRKEETAIPLEYLKCLDNLYEEWLTHKNKPVPADVVVIDANGDLPSVHHSYEELAGRLLSPVKTYG